MDGIHPLQLLHSCVTSAALLRVCSASCPYLRGVKSLWSHPGAPNTPTRCSPLVHRAVEIFGCSSGSSLSTEQPICHIHVSAMQRQQGSPGALHVSGCTTPVHTRQRCEHWGSAGPVLPQPVCADPTASRPSSRRICSTSSTPGTAVTLPGLQLPASSLFPLSTLFHAAGPRRAAATPHAVVWHRHPQLPPGPTRGQHCGLMRGAWGGGLGHLRGLIRPQ